MQPILRAAILAIYRRSELRHDRRCSADRDGAGATRAVAEWNAGRIALDNRYIRWIKAQLVRGNWRVSYFMTLRVILCPDERRDLAVGADAYRGRPETAAQSASHHELIAWPSPEFSKSPARPGCPFSAPEPASLSALDGHSLRQGGRASRRIGGVVDAANRCWIAELVAPEQVPAAHFNDVDAHFACAVLDEPFVNKSCFRTSRSAIRPYRNGNGRREAEERTMRRDKDNGES